jgi:hypothetical protein
MLYLRKARKPVSAPLQETKKMTETEQRELLDLMREQKRHVERTKENKQDHVNTLYKWAGWVFAAGLVIGYVITDGGQKESQSMFPAMLMGAALLLCAAAFILDHLN